jgi:hypothetical protein
MWWPRKKRRGADVAVTAEQVESALEETDVTEARQMRSDATRELAYLRMQSGTVIRIAEKLVQRREENHFGDEIQITFTPRRSHG